MRRGGVREPGPGALVRGATQFGPSLREQLRLALRISGRLFALLGSQCVEAREVRLTEELQLRAVGGRALRPALRLSHLRLELLYLHPHPHLAGMTLHLLVAHARARLVDTRALRRHLRLRILQLAEALLRLLAEGDRRGGAGYHVQGGVAS